MAVTRTYRAAPPRRPDHTGSSSSFCVVGAVADRRCARLGRRSDRPEARREIETGKPKPGVSGKSVGRAGISRISSIGTTEPRSTWTQRWRRAGINRRVVAVGRALVCWNRLRACPGTRCRDRLDLVVELGDRRAGRAPSIRRAVDCNRADSRLAPLLRATVRRSVCSAALVAAGRRDRRPRRRPGGGNNRFERSGRTCDRGTVRSGRSC